MEEPRNKYKKISRERREIDRIRYRLVREPTIKREIRSIDELIDGVFEGLSHPVSDSIHVLRGVWIKLVGPQIAKHSEPGFIKNFTLFVFVDHPGWIPELERIKRPLLGRVRKKYAGMRIRNIHFILEHK